MTNGTKGRKAGVLMMMTLRRRMMKMREVLFVLSAVVSFYSEIGRNSIYDLHCNGELMALIAGTNVIVLV